MTRYELIQTQLLQQPKRWLVTGVAGFIGSNLLEALLALNQRVVGLDNFATGNKLNLDEVQALVTQGQWNNFKFLQGDIRNLADCQAACEGVDYVLHQAALGSVPRSLADPAATNETNINGFLNMLVAARDARVQSFTYAASSSTYGDNPVLPKKEANIGNPLSPYAVTKYVNELYAGVFARSYGFCSIGLRYFNVFGPRQDPIGAYAAVIPKWIAALLHGNTIYINGDGETSRDFCYVANVVQANLLAATVSDNALLNNAIIPTKLVTHPDELHTNQIYNVALGERTTLNELFILLRDNLANHCVSTNPQPVYRDLRAGDVRHSQADIGKAQRMLGYAPAYRLAEGIAQVLPWYLGQR